MLPGIRFLLAAIVLSTSLLIFGLGAAALLRAAHEEVANVPVRRVMAEPVFAPRQDAAAPTLAMLRVDPAERGKTPDALPTAVSAGEPTAERVTEPREGPDLAAPKQDETAAAETPAPPPVLAAEPSPAETRLASLDAAPASPADTAPVAVEPIVAPAMSEPDRPAVKTVALGDPTATADTPDEAKKASENSDRAEIRRKKRAERARERRRQAARRAKLAAQQAVVQQAVDPFSEFIQSSQPTTTTPRRRQ